MAQETVNTQASSNPWPEMLDMDEPCMGAKSLDFYEYARLVPLIEAFLDPKTPEPLRDSIQFTLESDCAPRSPEPGQMLAHHFEQTNAPPPAWFVKRVQEQQQVATEAIEETRVALRAAYEACERGHAALRDHALMCLPRQGEFSQLEWDIETLLKKANECSPSVKHCRPVPPVSKR